MTQINAPRKPLPRIFFGALRKCSGFGGAASPLHRPASAVRRASQFPALQNPKNLLY
jgi:hypothetical protein